MFFSTTTTFGTQQAIRVPCGKDDRQSPPSLRLSLVGRTSSLDHKPCVSVPEEWAHSIPYYICLSAEWE